MPKALIIFLAIFLVVSLAHAEQRYFYDSLGRLTAEMDSAGNVAFYEYDSVGNLLAIRQGDPQQLSLVSFSPVKGLVGTTVTVLGSGFSAILSENQLFVNDTPATILSAENASIVFTVPNGATTGPIKIMTPRGTVQSVQPFTVLTGPSISSLDPPRVAQGTTLIVTIYGQNLPTIGQITFSDPGVTGIINSGGSKTQLPMTVTIAPSAPLGPKTFTITTTAGAVSSGPVALTVVPPVVTMPLSGMVSIFMPGPPAASPSGPAMTVTPGISVLVPSSTTSVPLAGPSASNSNSVSVSMPP
jgi:YD repeat-containing protein